MSCCAFAIASSEDLQSPNLGKSGVSDGREGKVGEGRRNLHLLFNGFFSLGGGC